MLTPSELHFLGLAEEFHTKEMQQRSLPRTASVQQLTTLPQHLVWLVFGPVFGPNSPASAFCVAFWSNAKPGVPEKTIVIFVTCTAPFYV